MRMFTATDLSPAHCGTVHCGPRWSLDRQWSERLRDYDIWLVWAGRGTMELQGGVRVPIEPGLCMCMRPGGLYLAGQDHRSPLRVTFAHFTLSDPALAEELPPEHRRVDDLPWTETTLRRAITLLHEDPEDPMPAMLLAAVLNDLRRPASRTLSGTAGHHHDIVEQAIAQLRRPGGLWMTPADLAREAGYSVDHFTRVFRQIRGQSPQDFIVTERITAARALLSESSLTVSQIASALGYSSVYYFSRQFRQVTGRTPTDARSR